MTYIDKLRADHPDWNEGKIHWEVIQSCPGDFGYPEDCDDNCNACWLKEYPEDLVKKDQYAAMGLIVDDIVPEKTEGPTEPHILDSGDRTQFESGAVRDMREGKGRFDICPLEVMGNYICADNDSIDPFIRDMSMFLNTDSVSYLYSAMHHFELMYYPDPYSMMLDVAIHFEQGAKKYGDANWKRGIPTWCYIDSATRHYIKCRRGDADEPHTRAVIWNLMCCIWEVKYGEEWRETQKLKEANE